ncbi:Cuticle protein 16.8 like protein [Argiope bruennichi]|uniref:Cuticle protein 16.8 like protein n=1 Tax=Argiope bruennichi TaxID=94029 RepID=A0A8T0E6W3_ARGBR|nr:Cuticle protein 16.8 like protein [Argiope bruennichi]
MISQAFVLATLAVAALASLHHEPIHHPQPFKFGYSVKDKHGEQHREEVGDGKNVKGSYGFTDARGIKRQVNYVADHAGFRAEVKTNEPGTANQNPAAVHIISDAPYGHGGYAGAAGLGYAGVGGAGYGYGGLGAAGVGYGYGGLGAAGVGYGNVGLGGYGGFGYGGYGLGNGLLAGLGYTRYAYPPSQPFKFGYSVKDKHGEQHREEVGDGKNVKGSYGFTDARGIKRQVNYVADHGGFRAEVKTNEPGTANQNPAAVHIISDAPYGHGGYAGAAGLGYAGVGGAGYGYGLVWVSSGVGYGNAGLGGYGGLGYGGYGIGNGLLGSLGYTRYGF